MKYISIGYVSMLFTEVAKKYRESGMTALADVYDEIVRDDLKWLEDNDHGDHEIVIGKGPLQ